MDDWAFNEIMKKIESPAEIQDLIEEDFFLTKFYAETANKIVGVSGKYHISTNALLEGVGEWIDKIKREVGEDEKD